MLRLALSALLLSGCYDSFSLFGDPGSGPADAASDGSSADGSTSEDGSVADGALVDAGIDAGPEPLDGAVPGVDAAPPDPTPPNPNRCRIEPDIFPFEDPVLEYRWPNGPQVHSDSLHVASTPLVIDLEPEGEHIEPVIVFVSYPVLGRGGDPGVLRIVDPRTDTTISYPPNDGQRGLLEATTNLAAGDIDGDGLNEIVGFGDGSSTHAFRSDGSLMWSSGYPRFNDLGTIEFTIFSGGPALADLEGDGSVEVIIGRAVLDGATGELIWDADDSGGIGANSFLGPLPCVADLDEDGFQEVIAGNTVYEFDGQVRWQADMPDGMCAVGDVYGDDRPEVVLVSSGYVRVLDPDTGARLWSRRLVGRASRNIGGAPTIADFDGDGQAEIGVAHGAAYGVYDPTCTGSSAGCVDEGLLWEAETDDGSSAGTGSSVFDFNGDGRAEVVYNDELHFRIFDGLDGTVLFQHRNSSRTRSENPTIADVDNDGDAEIVFCANAEARFIREFWTDPGIEIWGDGRGRWVGSRRIWNQHSYHISNVAENGAIPASPTPSWRTHNGYRNNLREGGDVLVVPDLWGQGEYECLDGPLARMSFTVANYGLERTGAGVVIGIYRGRPSEGGERVAELRTTRVLEPRGDSEVLSLDVELESPVMSYYALLDDPLETPGGSVLECREGNNEILIWRPSCP